MSEGYGSRYDAKCDRKEATDNPTISQERATEVIDKPFLRSIGARYNGNNEWLIDCDDITLVVCFTDETGFPGIVAKDFYADRAVCIIANCTRSRLIELLSAIQPAEKP